MPFFDGMLRSTRIPASRRAFQQAAAVASQSPVRAWMPPQRTRIVKLRMADREPEQPEKVQNLHYKPKAWKLETSPIPAIAYAERASSLSRLQAITELQKMDGFSARFISDSVAELTEKVSKSATALVPLFSELSAALDLNALYAERRFSFGLQAQCASDALHHLNDSVSHLNELVDDEYYKLDALVDLEAAMRLVTRFKSQAAAAEDELGAANELLRSIEPSEGPNRAIEAVVAAKVTDVKSELTSLITKLKAECHQLYLRERTEADNMDALW